MINVSRHHVREYKHGAFDIAIINMDLRISFSIFVFISDFYYRSILLDLSDISKFFLNLTPIKPIKTYRVEGL